jgi:hypothetical protein
VHRMQHSTLDPAPYPESVETQLSQLPH